MFPIAQKTFDPLFQEIKLKIYGSNISAYFRQYADSFTTLRKLSEQIDVFSSFLVLQNMGVSANIFPFKLPSISMAEVAIKPNEDVRVTLMEGLRQGIVALREKVVATLDDLVAQKQVGLIQWFSQSVCRFSYYTAMHKDQVVRQYQQRNQRITERERTHIHMMHIHDVIEAEQIPLPASSVKMPRRVRALINEFPESLKPFGRVVIGNEIATQTTEVNRAREIITETEVIESSFRRDPALILGHYVLAGWENGEV